VEEKDPHDQQREDFLKIYKEDDKKKKPESENTLVSNIRFREN